MFNFAEQPKFNFIKIVHSSENQDYIFSSKTSKNVKKKKINSWTLEKSLDMTMITAVVQLHPKSCDTHTQGRTRAISGRTAHWFAMLLLWSSKIWRCELPVWRKHGRNGLMLYVALSLSNWISPRLSVLWCEIKDFLILIIPLHSSERDSGPSPFLDIATLKFVIFFSCSNLIFYLKLNVYVDWHTIASVIHKGISRWN